MRGDWHVIERVLGRAQVVLTPNPALLWVAPSARVVAKSVDLPEQPWDARAAWGIPRDAPLFLLPGGLRPSKRNHLALEVQAAVPQGQVVVAGPVLDPAYASEFLHRVRHVVLPRERMWGAYVAADVVLNLAEHVGLANAVAEAMWVGRAVLATDHSGNQAALAETGLYFRDAADLRQQAKRLAEDVAYRQSLAEQAQARARRVFDPEAERRAHERAYRDALRV
jgi:glycosyltransferase involved in cell wall biosynthesis